MRARLLNMLPCQAFLNAPHHRTSDAELGSQVSKALFIQANQAYQFFRLALSHLSHRMPFTACLTTLLGHIRRVFAVGAYKEMVRPETRRYVANMQYVQTRRNRTDKFLITQPMDSTRMIVYGHLAVPVLVVATTPQPVSAIHDSLLEQTFSNGGWTPVRISFFPPDCPVVLAEPSGAMESFTSTNRANSSSHNMECKPFPTGIGEEN